MHTERKDNQQKANGKSPSSILKTEPVQSQDTLKLYQSIKPIVTDINKI
jgi:hypothetical protein